ncbi:unnamed protein product [Thelazia callipaeda]|uniref:Cadherin domain protein n=1 Tax=Thelazia callipaeda TaxID=103827 RepID=A0A158RCG6_THECL|nr:unnamed protein product [Thelazia callipaeda]
MIHFVADVPKGTLIGYIGLEPNLSYRLNGHNELVTVNIKSGEIYTTAPLDRETITSNGTIILMLTAEPLALIAIRINVLDINDNSPVFPSKYQNVSIVESAMVGNRIRLQSASDIDFAENGTIKNYELQAGSEFFKLVRSSIGNDRDILLIELLTKLDREQKDLFIFNITAYDGGNPTRSGYCTVYVNVLDANDNPPEFRQSHYDIYLNGSALVDSEILQVQATDVDLGENGRIRYHLIQNPWNSFQIHPDNGIISFQLGASLQHTTLVSSKEGYLQHCAETCVLAVEAEDYGEPKLAGRTLVYIHQTDTNLHDPEIIFRTYPADAEFISVSHATSIGSTIAIITANDRDSGQNVHISIIAGNSEKYFRLESGNNYGILRLNRSVDDELITQFSLTFRATDNGIPQRSVERTLIIFALSANDDHLPVLAEKLIKVSILEDSPVGSFVAAVRTSTQENLLHFSIIDGDKSDHLFTIGENTGIIITSEQWPNRTKWKYEFEVMVRRVAPSDKFSVGKVQVAIIDVNNHKPEFSSSFYEVDVLEDISPLTIIYKITATDKACIEIEKIKDYGNNSVISYYIDGSQSKQLFIIKEFSGEVVLRGKLNREISKQHQVTIIARDHGNPSQTTRTSLIVNVLDVNDNAPYFAQLEYHGYIKRDYPSGTKLVQVEAFDDDTPQFGQVSYLLYHVIPSFLSLDHRTGWIRLTTHAEQLNFEQKIEITVGAKDIEGNLSHNNATIHLWLLDSLQKIPKFSSLNNWSIEISENSSPEKVLASFSVESRMDNVRYRINTSDLLIDEFTGHLRARRSFDREIEPIISFTVYADGDWTTGMHQGRLLILDQNDNSPTCQVDGTTAHFVIDAKLVGVGAELFRLQCHDLDDGPNGEITYSIDSSFFIINPKTGIIRLMKFPHGFNQLQFHVMVTDNGEPSRHNTIKIVAEIKNEEIYSFPPTVTLLAQSNLSLGTIITSLAPINSTHRFKFQAVEMVAKKSYPVQILPSGEVFIASKFDSGRMRHLSIPVTALNLDKNPIQNKHEFLLQIFFEDTNNVVPRCPRKNRFHIAENNLPGAVVGVFSADDDSDGNRNSILFYDIVDKGKKLFHIDEYGGIIRALFTLDYEISHYYNITVVATYDGLLKAECLVVIDVLDLNDNIPKWDHEFYHFNFTSDGLDSFVGKVIAYDMDFGLNSEIRYKIRQKWYPFKINRTTGEIRQSGTLQPHYVYNLTVIATDCGNPSLSSITYVFIHTAAKKNCTPMFMNYPLYDIEINNSFLGLSFIRIHAVACGENIWYSLGYGNLSAERLDLFAIDAIDGSIFLTGTLDEYIGQRMELMITAETALSSNTITFGVVLMDNNKYGITKTITIHIQENNKAGEVCGKIDVSNNTRIIRQIPFGNAFRLHGKNLICDDVLDREKMNSYRLLLENLNKESIMVLVEVMDENDNFPQCNGTHAILIRQESSQFFPWECFDKDEGLNAAIGFQVLQKADSILDVNKHGFTVDPFKGALQHFSVLIYDRNTEAEFRDKLDELRKTSEIRYTLIPFNPGLEAQIDFKDHYHINHSLAIGTVFGTVKAKTGTTVEYFTTSFGSKYHDNKIMQWADINRLSGQLRIIQKPEGPERNMEITMLSEGFTKTIMVSFCLISKFSIIIVSVLN